MVEKQKKQKNLTLTFIPFESTDEELEALVAQWKKEAQAAEKKQTQHVTDPSQTKPGASNTQE